MKFKQVVLATTLALSGFGAAHANQTWAFSYSGAGVVASGTFTTASAAPAPQPVLSMSGTRNGVAILGLVPVGSSLTYSYDNEFSPVSPYFTSDGLLLDMAGSVPDVNVYFFAGAFTDLYGCDTTCVETPISFSVRAVPEPATVLSMLAGLGVMGVGMQLRRRRDTV